MILRAIRRLTIPLHRPSVESLVPYTMFDQERTDKEVRSARKMEGIYHRGQERVWDGKAVLAELVEKHGGVRIAPERIEPLQRMFAVIFWGELAAWKVAAEFALVLEPLEAKMAASAQAHDEARHFYVMHDYLQLLGYEPSSLPPAAHRILQEILGADSLAKKLVGMQLMVEPIALTLFQMVRENELEPVLCELLTYYERDEARHVALGVHYLPGLVKKMSRRELVDFYLWQIRMFMIQLDGVREMEEDFRSLGISPAEAIRLGQLKQLHAGRMVAHQMGEKLPAEELLTRAVEFRMALDFPPEGKEVGRLERWQTAIRVLFNNGEHTRNLQEELDRLKPGELFEPPAAA